MVQAKEKLIFNQDRQINQGISAAVAFLLENRNSEGRWLDFVSPSFGPSNEWMTAHVAGILSKVSKTHLSEKMFEKVSEVVMDSWQLLRSCQRSTGAWGWSSLCVEDADTTYWVLDLAEAVGAKDSETAKKARAFLETHKLPDSGMATYGNEEMFRQYFSMIPPQMSIIGYCGMAHVCVSAAIAALPEFSFRLRDYLKASQTSEGNWIGHWWRDHEYTTALAAEALAGCEQEEDRPGIDRAIAWGLQRLSSQGFVATSDRPNGSPWATAMCVRLLLLDRGNSKVKTSIIKATQWLLEQQQQNGSWTSSAPLQVPYLHDQNPEKFTEWNYNTGVPASINFDQNSINTTATVLYSLNKVAELL